jgi:hypothetical protein
MRPTSHHPTVYSRVPEIADRPVARRPRRVDAVPGLGRGWSPVAGESISRSATARGRKNCMVIRKVQFSANVYFVGQKPPNS